MSRNVSKCWDTKAKSKRRKQCEAKVRYSAYEAAQRAARDWRQHAYVCPVCGDYHLSSKR